MRFLFVSQSYPPDSCGVSHVVQSLCERLVDHGHETTVFTESRGRQVNEIRGVNIREFDVQGNYVQGYFGDLKLFVSALEDFSCDVLVVECAQAWTLDLSLPVLDKKKCLKIFHSHDFSWFKRKARNPIKNIKWMVYFWKLRYQFNVFDIIFCLSDSLPDFDYINRFYNKKIKILPNGVSDVYLNRSQLAVQSQKLASLKGKDYLVCLANFNKLKNQKDVLDAYIKCAPALDMIFVGSSMNEYSLRLQKQAASAGLADRVHFFSGCNKPEIAALLRSARLFIYASRLEAFPLVICESIASGTPWISYNVGCVKSFPGGVVVNKNRPVILAQEVKKLLGHNDLIKRLKEECQIRKLDYSYDYIVSDFLGEITHFFHLHDLDSPSIS